MPASPPRAATQVLSRSVETFLEMLAAERGVTLNTSQAYRRDLTAFAEFTAARGCAVDEADTEMIRAHMEIGRASCRERV